MDGLKYAIELIDKGFGVGIRKATKETEGLDKAVNKTQGNISNMAKRGASGFSSLIGGAVKLAGVLGIMASVGALTSVASQALETKTTFDKLSNSILLRSGKEGEKNISYLDGTIKRLNLDMESSYKGYDQMNAKMLQAGYTSEKVNKTFEGFSTASMALKNTGGELESLLGGVSKLSQNSKVSLGSFQSEIGDRIPGALKIAAEAMGMTESKFVDLLNNGKIYTKDFLPAFAGQLQKTFGEGMQTAASSMEAAENRKNNAAIKFQRSFGGIIEGVKLKVLENMTIFTEWAASVIPMLKPVQDAFGNILKALSPLWDSLVNLFKGFSAGGNTLKTVTTIMNGLAVVVEILSNGLAFFIDLISPLAPIIGGLVAAQWAWNTAMTANPIGAVITLVVSLIGAIIYAYNKIGWFRGGIKAAWEALKTFGDAVKIFVIERIKTMISGITGMGRALMLFFKGEWSAAFDAGKQAVKDLTGIEAAQKAAGKLKGLGQKMGDAYQQGVKEAAQNKNKSGKGLFDISVNSPIKDFTGKNDFSDLSTTGASAKGKGDGKNKKEGGGLSVPSSGSGKTEKHMTFNINSFVKELTIVSNQLGSTPEQIKRELRNIFNESITDLEIRASE